MKEAYYFPHDANARTDAKILELRAEMGWEGYGLWWALVEQLREATDYRLSNVLIGGLAMGLSVPKADVRQFLDLCIGLGLLAVEGDCFYAPALRRRMEPWDAKRAALSDAGKRGAGKRWAADKPADSPADTTPTPPECPADSQAIATPLAGPIAIKEKEIRGEESKEESSSLRSEDAATAAAGGQEKKIGAEDFQLESLAPAQTKPPVAKPPRESKPKAAPISGPLADLLNTGGLADEVQGMKKPFTQQQADELVSKYGEGPAREIVQEMANWKPLHQKCQSASLTAQNWLNKRGTPAPAREPQRAFQQQPFRPPAVSQVEKRQTLSAQLREKYQPQG